MSFIGMLAFQLAGALILLLNCCKGNKKTVIENCFPGSNVVERDENNNCTIPKEKLQESAHKIYLNILAFGDLVIGYAIAAFSPVQVWSTLYTVLGVAGITLLLLLGEYYLSKLFARIVYAEDEIVSYNELEKSGVDTFVTDKEIYDMFKDDSGK